MKTHSMDILSLDPFLRLAITLSLAGKIYGSGSPVRPWASVLSLIGTELIRWAGAA